MGIRIRFGRWSDVPKLWDSMFSFENGGCGISRSKYERVVAALMEENEVCGGQKCNFWIS